jgi:hypothetical protein
MTAATERATIAVKAPVIVEKERGAEPSKTGALDA